MRIAVGELKVGHAVNDDLALAMVASDQLARLDPFIPGILSRKTMCGLGHQIHSPRLLRA